MERAKPTMEQILVVRNPQRWLSEGSFSAAHPQARRAGEDGACWWQGHAEEVAGAQPEQPPDSTHPAPLPAATWASGQQPHKAFSWRNERGEAFGAYAGRMAALSIRFLQRRWVLGLMDKGWTAGEKGCAEQEPAMMSPLHNAGWF